MGRTATFAFPAVGEDGSFPPPIHSGIWHKLAGNPTHTGVAKALQLLALLGKKLVEDTK